MALCATLKDDRGDVFVERQQGWLTRGFSVRRARLSECDCDCKEDIKNGELDSPGHFKSIQIRDKATNCGSGLVCDLLTFEDVFENLLEVASGRRRPHFVKGDIPVINPSAVHHPAA